MDDAERDKIRRRYEDYLCLTCGEPCASGSCFCGAHRFSTRRKLTGRAHRNFADYLANLVGQQKGLT